MKSCIIETETIREIVAKEQYTVRPLIGYYTGDNGVDYEVVIQHNGEEWTVFARFFPGEPETFNQAQAAQYFDMLPRILQEMV